MALMVSEQTLISCEERLLKREVRIKELEELVQFMTDEFALVNLELGILKMENAKLKEAASGSGNNDVL